MGYECKKCTTVLIRGSNWTEGAARNGDYYCSECRSERQREYYRSRKDEINKQQRKRYQENRDEILAKQRKRHVRKKYGMSLEEYEEAMSKTCEVCGKDSDLVIDHCHNSDKVRGVLCRQCNMAIGLLGDNLQGVEKAQKYLSKEVVS